MAAKKPKNNREHKKVKCKELIETYFYCKVNRARNHIYINFWKIIMISTKIYKFICTYVVAD